MGDPSSKKLHSSPVLWRAGDRELVICNLPDQSTVCVDPSSGDELWRVKSLAGHSTPVVVGDRLLTYGSSRKGGLRCYELSTNGAKLLWNFHATADSGSSPVAIGGHVFVQGDRRLACVNMETGKEEWMTELDISRPRYTSLVAADNKVIYAFDGLLCFAADNAEFRQLMKAKIDAEGTLAEESYFRKLFDMDELEKTAEGQKQAERVWRQNFSKSGPLTCSTPAIVDGKIYFRLQNGVACYDLRAER